MRVLAGSVTAVAAAVALLTAFRGYQNPAYVIQWLALLQLCQ